MTDTDFSLTGLQQLVDDAWEELLPILMEYIAIPAKSPAFEPAWEAEGHLASAAELIRSWCETNTPADASVVMHEIPGRTPVITIELPDTAAVGAAGGSEGIDGGNDGECRVTIVGPSAPVEAIAL